MSGQRFMEQLPKRFRSRYLDASAPGEVLHINDIVIDLDEQTVEGTVTVETDPRLWPGYDFWWTGHTAYRAAVQLALGYAGIAFGREKEEIGEVLQTESHQNTRYPVKGHTQRVSVRFPRLRERGRKAIGRMEYRISGTEFGGTVRFAAGFRPATPSLARWERAALNVFNVFDTIYHWSGLRDAIAHHSMYDACLEGVDKTSFSEVWNAIALEKIRKTERLISLKRKHGAIPSYAKFQGNNTPCGALRLAIASKYS